MHRFNIDVATEANGEATDLTPDLVRHLRELRRSLGPTGLAGPMVAHLFVLGSTAALTTMEYEVGLVKHDLPRLLQRLVPDDARYEHEASWQDDNGHAHLRAALIGPSVMVPVQDGKLVTGEHQQVVLVDFDTRPRRRTVVVTVFG